jgi:hypothetical protein
MIFAMMKRHAAKGLMVMLTMLLASVAARAEDTGTAMEDGPLKGLAARVLTEGNSIVVTPKIALSLGLVAKAETPYKAYDKYIKTGKAMQDLRVSRQPGRTDMVFGYSDPATKTLNLYLTSPAGDLTKAVTLVNGNYTDVPLDQAQAGFHKAVDYWTKALPPLKTGSFETTFMTRSPYSEMKALTQRLAYEGDTTDYDLGNETFLVYVPDNYNPKKPMGLLVLANYKQTDSLPDPVLPQLADANMALVVAKDYPQDQWWQRAGMALDAAYNMQQLYKIDPRRVYIFGGGDWHPDGQNSPMVGERVGLNFPEVFAGTFTQGLYGYTNAPDGRGGEWVALMPKPGPRALSMAKARPLVVGDDGVEGSDTAFAAAMTQDGFGHLKRVIVTTDQFHYPNYTTDWLPGVLKYMDDTTTDLSISGSDDDLASPETGP